MKGIIPNGKNVRVFEIGSFNKTELKITIKNPNWLDLFSWKASGDYQNEESDLLFVIIVEDESRGKYKEKVSEKRFHNQCKGKFSKAVDSVITNYKNHVYFESFEEYVDWCTMSEIKNEKR